jgi:hypothetical protein
VTSVVNSCLLLEQILKRCACIIGTQARRRRRLFLPRDANLEQLAMILRIFLRDPLLHRLHALKPAPRIEIRALLARMKFESALRALPVARNSLLQHGAALRAPRHRPRPRQVHRPRSQSVVPLRRAALTFRRRLARLRTPRFSIPITVLISRLTIFRHKSSPSTRPYSPPDRPSRQVPSKKSSHGSSPI